MWTQFRGLGLPPRSGAGAAVDLLLPPGVRLLLPRPARHPSRSTEVGVDNITFETDYPHSDSTWPHTKAVAEKMFAGLSDEDTYKIVRGNAIRMLHLDFDR